MKLEMTGARRKRRVGKLAALLAVLAVLAATGAVAVYALTWPVPMQIPGSDSVRDWDAASIAEGSNKVYVAWAPGAVASGIRLAKLEGQVWTASSLASPLPDEFVWSPSLAYSETVLGAAWAQGQQSGSCDRAVTLVQQNPGSPASVIPGVAYGPATAPDLAVGSSGWHMVFAAATSSQDCRGSRVDLYYTNRSGPGQTWITPTVVVTHSEVVSGPTTTQGGIWYPRIAAEPAGSEVYISWEQYQKTTGGASDSQVWVITGSVQSGVQPTHPTWSAPAQLSPPDQTDAVRPAIAVDEAGTVRVVWASLVGSRTNPTEQHVYYRVLSSSVATHLNTEAIRVTAYLPAVAGSAIAVRGDTICVTWHGYAASLGGSGREEITLRCSENGGGIWQPETNVSTSSGLLSIFPTIGLAVDGLVNIAWVEYALLNDVWVPQGVYYRSGPSRSDDGRVFLPLVTRGR